MTFSEEIKERGGGELRSLRNEFIKHSTDYLKLLSQKAQRAKGNKTLEEEFGILEFFFDGVEAIICQYDKQIHLLKLQKVQARFEAKFIATEYENMAKDIDQILNIDRKKPTQKQLDGIRDKYSKGDIKVLDIYKHFEITDEQLKYIING